MMRFLEYMNLRQHENSRDLTELREILIDTAIMPFFINPKLRFGQRPSPDTLETINLAIGAVITSRGFADRYHLTPEALELALDSVLCVNEGIRKYICMELDVYFKRAFATEQKLLLDIGADNDKRIMLVAQATRWLACAYPTNYAVIKLFNEANTIFNRSLKEYKSSLVHH